MSLRVIYKDYPRETIIHGDGVRENHRVCFALAVERSIAFDPERNLSLSQCYHCVQGSRGTGLQNEDNNNITDIGCCED